MAAHAKLSPSSAHRWMRCAGSVALCDTLPPAPSSAAADEGTFCHEVAAECLTCGTNACDIIGYEAEIAGRRYTLDEDTANEIQCYLDAVRFFANGAEVLPEQAIDISEFTGEAGAKGTADALAIVRQSGITELHVHDLKMGRGVEVQAKDNEQLLMYAAGAMEQFSAVENIDKVRVFIHQPRISREPKVAVYDVADIGDFTMRVRKAAAAARRKGAALTAGDKQCRWCPAKAVCPELRRVVDEATAEQFSNESDDATLGAAMDKIDLIEQWCRAVRDEVASRLLAGRPVPGYKLVQGRRGVRKWSDESMAEAQLVTALGDAAYEKSILSVATAEKRMKKNPGMWEALIPLISQAPGGPTVAPAGDPRPEFSGAAATADAFSTVE